MKDFRIWRFLIFFLLFIFTVYLVPNRFSISVVDAPQNYTLFKNTVEHLLWGFITPILMVILCFGLGVFFRTNTTWKCGYYSGLIILVGVDIWYYIQKGYADIPKITLDAIGAGLSLGFIMSGRTKMNSIIGKNITCPECGANGYHIDRLGEGKYAVKCFRANSKKHQRIVQLSQDTLGDLEKR